MKDVEEAIEFIAEFYKQFGEDMYIAYSGGKDSSVILDLALRVDPNMLIIHNPKPITHPETVKHIYKVSQEHRIVLVPMEYMDYFVQTNGFLCQIDGTTIEEWDRVDKRNDIIMDGKNISRKNMPRVNEKGIWGIMSIYPIYEWTEEEVFGYIFSRQIEISKEYKS
jgi:3'-phosphoadenosine 5'-phosphosulfate sulfotransferase (PAPS reductase)/FAD synthetase